jgi:hypothetical protein
MAALMVVWMFAPATAQDQPAESPKPEFDNAPVADVLGWAQKSLGVGFVYDGKDLADAAGQPRRVTSKGVVAETRAQKLGLLLDLLRRAGLVAFEIGGMPGPSYQLYTGETAARQAPIVESPAGLKGMYFGGLSIRLQRAVPADVAARVREKLSPVGQVEVFAPTGALIVTDFADRLVAAWEVARLADEATARDEDTHVVTLPVAITTPAARHLAALERLRGIKEGWKGTVNEQANVVLISGRRDECARVEGRSKQLSEQPTAPAYAETTHVMKVVFLSGAEAARILREMFALQIESGSVQIAGQERPKSVVFKGSEFDALRAKETLAKVDVQEAAPRRD